VNYSWIECEGSKVSVSCGRKLKEEKKTDCDWCSQVSFDKSYDKLTPEEKKRYDAASDCCTDMKNYLGTHVPLAEGLEGHCAKAGKGLTPCPW